MIEGSDPLTPAQEESPLATPLEQQLCFALYVSAKEIIRRYKPLLEPLHLTYTGYITMMVLWERDGLSVKELGERLTLDSGTLTPVLKKLAAQGYVVRTRSPEDERTVLISLTARGRELRAQAAPVPQQLFRAADIDPAQTVRLTRALRALSDYLFDRRPGTVDS